MISVEEASRSVDILIGICCLIMLAILVFGWLYVRALEESAKDDLRKAVRTVKSNMEQKHATVIHELKTQSFISDYNAKETIKSLEEKVMRLQSENDRMRFLLERCDNGQK